MFYSRVALAFPPETKCIGTTVAGFRFGQAKKGKYTEIYHLKS